MSIRVALGYIYLCAFECFNDNFEYFLILVFHSSCCLIEEYELNLLHICLIRCCFFCRSSKELNFFEHHLPVSWLIIFFFFFRLLHFIQLFVDAVIIDIFPVESPCLPFLIKEPIFFIELYLFFTNFVLACLTYFSHLIEPLFACAQLFYYTMIEPFSEA